MDDIKQFLSKWAAAVPDLGKLLFRLSKDPRVPTRSKITFLATAAYLVAPFDFIPDWIPGLGSIDDIVLVVLALDLMVNKVSDDVVMEHWDGDPAMLGAVQSALASITELVPDRIKRLMHSRDLDGQSDIEL